MIVDVVQLIYECRGKIGGGDDRDCGPAGMSCNK
jgi:hypothetical protein